MPIPKELRARKGHSFPVYSGSFSPDGKRLASAGSAGQGMKAVMVWDVKTGEEVLALKADSGGAARVCFSPDGQRLATGGCWRTAKVWDARTGQELLYLKGNPIDVTSVCFSPDGKRLATGSGGGVDTHYKPLPGEVKVWDAQTGQEVLALKGHTGAILTSVCFSPDGKRLASASSYLRLEGTKIKSDWGEVKVWDAQTGQEILSLEGQTGAVHSVAFSPDSKRLAHGDGATVRIFRLPDAE
jgi:WD40 repeat protein